jgi:hypothetical protein
MQLVREPGKLIIRSSSPDWELISFLAVLVGILVHELVRHTDPSRMGSDLVMVSGLILACLWWARPRDLVAPAPDMPPRADPRNRSMASPRCLPANEHRHLAMGEDLHCLAAQYQRRHPSAAVRRHHDQVTAFVLDRVDDALVRMLVFKS